MKWTVKIENNPDLRILILYEPFGNKLVLNGMHKEKSMQWACIANKEYDYKGEVLLEIENMLYDIYETMKTVLDNVTTIDSVFNKLKLIEINETD